MVARLGRAAVAAAHWPASLYRQSSLLSVIIPTHNEAANIGQQLQSLASWRAAGHEVIVVDGGSTDDTIALASEQADTVITGPPGRAVQMNRGAEIANGSLLIFLHADTRLPATAEQQLSELARGTMVWGRFDVLLDGNHALYRVIGYMMNWRSRATRIATGDQAIFVGRDLFDAVGGFPDIELMEDIAICRSLRRLARPACLRARVVTSVRRWQQHGIIRTIVLMWLLRLAYWLRVSPRLLQKIYEAG